MTGSTLSALVKLITEDPIIAWFAVLALLLVIGALGQAVWDRRRAGAKSKVVAATELKTTSFTNRTEILILFIALTVLLAALFAGYRVFFA
ncbi:MAG TPA: hypothetical protein VMN81_09080 [Vicinamibacterales bacterium]|nr:hypothetical protein [Vicinamibacterales bacterium]